MPRLSGIDISVWDDGIDLAEWKSRHGIAFVVVKCGGNEGGRYRDRCLADHMRKAKAAGLHVGAYYYTTVTTVAEAIADAEHCVSLVRGHDLDMPVFMDVEDKAQFGLSKRQLTDVIKAFCDRVQELGYRAGLYTGGHAWLNDMHADELRKYCTWIASWQADWPSYVGRIDMWQQGTKRLSDGRVYYDDVSGCQDFDWCEASVIQGGSTMPKKTIDVANVAALIHMDMVTDPRNGYNQQPQRWGGDHPDGVKVLDIGDHRYQYKLGSYDCSSSVITAWSQALRYTAHEGALDAATYTGDMRKVFVGSGLFSASLTPAKRGDVYLAEEKHTAMCQDGGFDGVLGYDALSEFNRNERHAASYGEPGDQDGYESVLRGYYDDGWNTVLHYVGGNLEDVTAEDEPQEVEVPVGMFVKFDGDATEHYWDGQRLHAIANVDEKNAIVEFLALGGTKIDTKPKEFGTKDAPWGARLNDVLSRGAEFDGFERFNPHPSTRKVVKSVVSDELNRVQTNILTAIAGLADTIRTILEGLL